MMINRKMRRIAARFLRDESGNGTIEFVIFVPFFLMLFLSSFEVGMLMARNVMLDRGLDIAVRQVRLGQMDPVNHTNMKTAVCDAAVIIPNCMSELRLEMRPLDPRGWQNIPDTPDCVNAEDPSAPVRQFVAGQPNQLMIVRACAIFDPIAPKAGFGEKLSGGDDNDRYALFSSAAYVVEPN
ncbi:TadE/TadG family type IV pilus assembly protein [Flavimaricola marinus]|uniref:TadE-like protein n=1 Tax=Flavimaricola marinus TaxID=1819565 RepID=A0A238LI01_9RHOB|nr:TadE/TadG family type IV pilus assembly protein [Flavimaricola marinus]SMY08586.1 TadE-like protein [Flavimaricola marinus]